MTLPDKMMSNFSGKATSSQVVKVLQFSFYLATEVKQLFRSGDIVPTKVAEAGEGGALLLTSENLLNKYIFFNNSYGSLEDKAEEEKYNS